METEIERVNEHIKFEQCYEVLEYATQRHCSIVEACQATGMARSTFYRHINDGVLENYLGEAKESRRQAAQSLAIESLPDVLRYQIKLATGDVVERGANPTTAAKLVLEIAGVKDAEPKAMTIDNATFLPEQIHINISKDEPDGDVIDGEASVIDAGTLEEQKR